MPRFFSTTHRTLPVSNWISLPVIAALVGAFGFSAAAVTATGAPTLVAVAVGVVVGLALATLTARLVNQLLHMPTDGSLRTADLVGRPGRVVMAITPTHTGEVLVNQAGQQLKLAARSNEHIAAGEAIMVVATNSPTLVTVESHGRFWSNQNPDTESQ